MTVPVTEIEGLDAACGCGHTRSRASPDLKSRCQSHSCAWVCLTLRAWWRFRTPNWSDGWGNLWVRNSRPSNGPCACGSGCQLQAPGPNRALASCPPPRPPSAREG